MVLESRAAEAAGILKRGEADRITALLERLGLPTCIPAGIDPGRILEAARSDKKSRKGELRYALPAANRPDGPAEGPVRHPPPRHPRPVAPDLPLLRPASLKPASFPGSGFSPARLSRDTLPSCPGLPVARRKLPGSIGERGTIRLSLFGLRPKWPRHGLRIPVPLRKATLQPTKVGHFSTRKDTRA